MSKKVLKEKWVTRTEIEGSSDALSKKVLKENWVTRSEIKGSSDALPKEKRVASDMKQSVMCKENFNGSETNTKSKNLIVTVNQRPPFTPIQLNTPCKLSREISLSSSDTTVRRSSRSKKSRRLSKLHLVPVTYSSDGSEGSLSDLDDIMPKDILKESENHERVLSTEGLSGADAVSADDELSGHDYNATIETAKVKKKVKKKSDKNKKSPRRLLMLKQTEKKINQLSLSEKYQSEDKLVYHGRNFVPKTIKDEMEMECDFSWVKIQNKNRILEFTDVNEAEKVLMSLWNEHVRKYHGIGFINLDKILIEFVEDHFSVISEQEIYRNFVCHVVSYHKAGLISQSSVIGSFTHLQEHFVKHSLPAMQINNNMRNSTKDPITILNNTFVNLSLKSGQEKWMTDSVDSFTSDQFSVITETLDLSEQSEVLDEESNDLTSSSAAEVTKLMEKCMI